MGIIDYIDRKMADEMPLSILGPAVQTGNVWRKENTEVRVKLRKADLKQANLFEADLTRTELFEYIEVFYNARRKHSTPGYLSPGAFEKKHRRSITIAA